MSTESSSKNYYSTRFLVTIFILFALILILSVFFSERIVDSGSQLIESLGPEFLLFVLGGFIVQMIDGSAPIAASLTQKLPIKTMMIVVGLVVIAASIRIIIVSFL